MKIMGIDPGLATAGFGVIEWDAARRRAKRIDHGAFASKPATPLAERLAELAKWLRGAIEEHRPEAAAIEEVFHGRNAKTAVMMAHGRGVCLLMAAEAGVPVTEYSALLVKKSVSGYGRADKHQLQVMVAKLLGLDQLPEPHHASDALALAVCHAYAQGDPRLAAAREAGAGGRDALIGARSGSKSRRLWRDFRPPGAKG
jgi:crossover junction endodeoxyribonuclease RuvC